MRHRLPQLPVRCGGRGGRVEPGLQVKESVRLLCRGHAPALQRVVGVLVHIAVVDVGGNAAAAFAGKPEGGAVKKDQIDLQLVLLQKGQDGLLGHLDGPVRRVAVDPRRDQREGHALAAVRRGQLQRGAVAGRQRLPLAAAAAMPHRPHRVDDVPAGQAPRTGDLGAAGGAAAQGAAFRQQGRPRRPVDGPVHTAAAPKRGVGGVDDGIHLPGGDIVADKRERHGRVLLSLSGRGGRTGPRGRAVLFLLYYTHAAALASGLCRVPGTPPPPAVQRAQRAAAHAGAYCLQMFEKRR